MAQLRKIIPSLLGDNPAPDVVREFVYICCNMSAAYLRVKIARGRLDLAMFGVPLDDLALDCVADLFERNSAGRFTEVQSYYEPLRPSTASEEALFGATRRLIFSKVNEGLFELYRAHDRSLSNIIRNIKIGLKSHRKLFTFDRNNEVWVRTADPIKKLEPLPLLPSEIIESQLLIYTSAQRNVRDLLDAFAIVLQSQELYRKQYPLIGLAFICRAVLQRAVIVTDAIAIDPEELTAGEILKFLRASLGKIHIAMKPSYVGSGKLDESTYNTYFDSIKDILQSEFIQEDGARASYFDFLKTRMVSLNEADYMKNHRVYLEYLAKLVRKAFLETISQELRIETKP